MTDTIANHQSISGRELGGERPLFAAHHLILSDVTFTAGESALKCCRDIQADHCRFEGKYPLWHCKGVEVTDSVFTPGARAAIWYTSQCVMKRTRVEAPKMFREVTGVTLEDVEIPDAQETLWHCNDIRINRVRVSNADYLFMHSGYISINDYVQHGNYSFQYCSNVVIRNADIHSKDAFWGTEDVTVYDSRLQGEYLGWHSRRLRLVRCHISGTQPLCYCKELVLEDCTFDADADLAFEDSDLTATILSPVTSIKNPRSGRITLPSAGEIIIDANVLQPADCVITQTDIPENV
ncbi:MAG: DUF3737 family protein [Duncaniella sp.]|nr:DUF3737 family protein [Duncaniella sp.]